MSSVPLTAALPGVPEALSALAQIASDVAILGDRIERDPGFLRNFEQIYASGIDNRLRADPSLFFSFTPKSRSGRGEPLDLSPGN